MHYVTLLFVALWPLACRAERPQRSAVKRLDSSDQIPIERIRPSCGGTQPCATWVISTPAYSRGDDVLRFAGSYLTIGDRAPVTFDLKPRRDRGGSVHPLVRSFFHPRSLQNRLVLHDVLVTGGQIRPVIWTRLQCLVRMLLVGGSNRSLDVLPRAEMCDHGIVVVNL